MEKLAEELDKGLTLDTVGVIHHPFCLNHSAEDNLDLNLDPKSFGNHPERPQRVLAILDQLKKAKLLSKCDVLQDFNPCEEEMVTLIHAK